MGDARPLAGDAATRAQGAYLCAEQVAEYATFGSLATLFERGEMDRYPLGRA
jgi:hypothetical protein